MMTLIPAVILITLWLISVGRSSLFWLYLLQLKEYRINRLIDHFRTEKGQRILLDPLLLIKIVLLISYGFWGSVFVYAVFLIFAAEAALAIRTAINKTLRRPALTSKSIPLIGALGIIELLFAGYLLFNSELNTVSLHLLIFNVFLPFIALALVLALKPLNLLLRRKVINAAKAKRREMKDLLVIGITGSYGKTSTKEFLYTILKNRFRVIKTPEHVNTEIGIANFILQELKPEHEVFICEIGAYVRGEVKDICEIVKPKIGVFVGANEQHLALFGSMKNLLRAEGGEELLEALPSKGLGIFNGNNIYSYDLWKRVSISKKITYVPTLVNIINPERRDMRAENIEVLTDKIKFRVVSAQNSKGADFVVNLLGSMNIENILLAASVAEELGMNLKDISKECWQIEPMKGTMNLKKIDGLNIINSTYSSNPSAVEAHLEYLKVWPSKKVVIMPCLIELGPASAKIHERIGELLAKTADLTIITTKDQFDRIIKGASKVIGDATDRIIYLDEPSEIVHKIRIATQKGDVILLEGRLPSELVKSLENL